MVGELGKRRTVTRGASSARYAAVHDPVGVLATQTLPIAGDK